MWLCRRKPLFMRGANRRTSRWMVMKSRVYIQMVCRREALLYAVDRCSGCDEILTVVNLVWDTLLSNLSVGLKFSQRKRKKIAGILFWAFEKFSCLLQTFWWYFPGTCPCLSLCSPWHAKRIKTGEALVCLEFLWHGVSQSGVYEQLVSLHYIGPALDLLELWGWDPKIRILASSLCLFCTIKFEKPWPSTWLYT